MGLKKIYFEHKSDIEKFEGLLLNNTVLERGLVISPVIVAANTVQNALVLGTVFMCLTFFTVLFSSFVSKKLAYTFRVIIYTIISALVYIPIAFFMNTFFQEIVFKIGIFMPLLITNALIVTKSETRFFRMKRWNMALDLISHTLGFLIVIIIVGAIREVIGNATYAGQVLDMPIKISAFVLPFGGFVLVGFMAAIVQKVRLYFKSTTNSEKEEK